MQREDRVRGERRTAQVSERVLAPLQRVLRWLLSLRDDEGRVICPVHKVEHTGKSAYVALLAARLALLDPSCDRAALIAAARQQGRRLVDNLVREGTSPCHTFRPGRHDPFNCSNSVIDGGACSDALAVLGWRSDRIFWLDRDGRLLRSAWRAGSRWSTRRTYSTPHWRRSPERASGGCC